MTVPSGYSASSSTSWQALLAEQQQAAPAPAQPPSDGLDLALGAGWMLVLMFFLLPVLGAPEAAPVGDSVKSAIVAFGTLGAVLWYALKNRAEFTRSQGHWFLAMGALLTLYSAGSIFWAHAYLATGETVRWGLFTLLLWQTLQLKSRSMFVTLSWAVHLGVFLSSLVIACQYWFGVEWFAQSAQPASTFVNRNFFSEYAACALPFSIFLLSRLRVGLPLYLLTVSLAFNVVAFFMTGTRSALFGMMLAVLATPALFWFYRRPLGLVNRWRLSTVLQVTVLFSALVIALGMLPTGNAVILQENAQGGRSHSAFAHSFQRIQAMGSKSEYTEGSVSVRLDMWKSVMRAIAAHPVAGVGAGAWEVVIPLYQPPKTELEIDYYVHNEFLQLLVEYGIAGWVFLLGLFGLLGRTAWQLLKTTQAEENSDVAMRLTGLASLLLLLWVSNLGFPLHLAGTGAFFAVSIALMVPSRQTGRAQETSPEPQAVWRQAVPYGVAGLAVLGLLGSVYVTRQAFYAEDRFMRSIGLLKAAKQIKNPADPRRARYMEMALTSGKEGVEVTPHYRKLMSQISDEFNGLGDWKNAVWAYEIMAQSRPNIPVIWANLAIGYSYQNNHDKAKDALAKAQAIKPDAHSVRYADVLVTANAGDIPGAAKKLRRYIEDDGYNASLVEATRTMAPHTGDWELVVMALKGGRIKAPQHAVQMSLQLADAYQRLKQPDEALLAFRDALVYSVKTGQVAAVQARIPSEIREKAVGLANAQLKADAEAAAAKAR